MSQEKASEKGWVYVVVCEPEREATFLGLHDEEKNVNFIPAFESKDAANDCFLTLPREKGKKYEVQAVHIDELHQDAEQNGFIVALLDGDGKLINS